MAKSLQEEAKKTKIFYYYEKDFLADLRYILAVFKYKYLKITAT